MGSNVFLRLLFVLLQSSCEIASKFVEEVDVARTWAIG